MGFNCGIVGLPNVGKSTLFNALTQTASAQSANYPFCTIEPNTGRVAVPDARLGELARIGHSQKEVPTSLEFVDIAGLVRGASKGEGLGNQFLANIREVDAIIHVLRCFDDDDITHVEGGVDPVRDAEIIETELMLADLASLERREVTLQKRARGNDREAKDQLELMKPLIEALQNGQPARTAVPKGQEREAARLQLMTTKPVLYVCNVEEGSAATGNRYSDEVKKRAEAEGAGVVIVSAAIEAEVSQLDSEERGEFLDGLGLSDSGLDRVIAAGYRLLGLQTYFTVGPKETRAWTITEGTKAPQAAAVIHNDFERGFIACETVAYDDYIEYGGESGAREAGKLRIEGKSYVVQDGDVLLFRFNV
ncbi:MULTISPECIES: redox-regulated ATPase YchF [unclassified Saccharibacter]|uniref:redox-regulated ATPase YchF n=1 Tax=unclassified Saccharibacter TaxID=2648722 RepID=UPI001328E8F9|nr:MULTISPECIES: redox-regulated ATPase YchF [unclassified Saccharibacter]MXV36352.1 redox-regulated ATPase YchF [Saccharibacter sp. EH611]MXV57514.1 redox-regulated ATPase YchF [Saccharibacter sp. EH70]MXV65179.1 redox-regulated ATPase YchF [Saccharibacter sp. EH60]